MHVLEKCSYNLEGAMVSEVFKNDEYIHHFVKLHRGQPEVKRGGIGTKIR